MAGKENQSDEAPVAVSETDQKKAVDVMNDAMAPVPSANKPVCCCAPGGCVCNARMKGMMTTMLSDVTAQMATLGDDANDTPVPGFPLFYGYGPPGAQLFPGLL